MTPAIPIRRPTLEALGMEFSNDETPETAEWKATQEIIDRTIKEANQYLAHFCIAEDPEAPMDPALTVDHGSNRRTRLVCPKCGAALGGLLGSFTWGIQHGEGFCARDQCGWPARGHHVIEVDNGDAGDKARLAFSYPLAYHPDVVTTRSDEAPETATDEIRQDSIESPGARLS